MSENRFQTYESVTVGDIRRFGSYAVTAEEIIEFAEKYDPQDFHLDDAAAKRSLFGALCASGWHTGAMMMRMMVDTMKERGQSLGSPGVDELRWLKPVYAGDTLSVELEVLEKRPLKSRPGVGIATSRGTVFNQNNEPVMTLKSSAFYPMAGTDI